jgi:hypothetical protein
MGGDPALTVAESSSATTAWQSGRVVDEVNRARPAAVSELVVPRRFRGPSTSGNGGWSAGALAHLLDPHHESAVTVTLRRPPPLETPLDVTAADAGLVATVDGTPVLEAVLEGVLEVDSREPVPVAPVPADEARAAEAAYPGLAGHPFPECFACGTGRDPGDGLRIFPGRVSDQEGLVRAAATWTPDESLSEDWHEYAGAERRASLPATWAALDCVGAWAADMAERMMVLGRMTTRITSLPVVGEEHVVVGLARSADGRKHHTSASVYDSRGALVGAAEHVWITVNPEVFSHE